MNDLKTRLTHIVASKPELLKNLNISIPQLWMFVDHLIANDVVPVVRCKDCVHSENDAIHQVSLKCKKFSPGQYTHRVMPDDFCSYGERKDNE